ncbi:MAG: AraC family transcriptional regulator ligand-binding domain-containing protein [Archangium sp.]|nr:AraC family transcriptional regulator ligand-binding domain-containing protein [Archangium sp.]
MVLKSRFRVHIVGPVCRFVAERGGDVAALLKRAQLPADAATQPWVEMTLPALHRFHSEAEKASGEPLLGVRVGQSLPPTTWDVIQLACRSAKTLGEALRAVPALIGLFNVYVELQVTPGDGSDAGREPGKSEWSLDHRIAGEPEGLSRHGNELWVATVLSQMQRVTGAEVKPTRLWFGHAKPKCASEVGAALGCARVTWGAGSTGLAVSARDAERAVLSADPMTAQVLDRLATQVLGQTAQRRGTAALVYGALREMQGRVPGIREVAKTLALSERSLQRGLQEEGANFRELVDQARRDLTRELQAREVPLDEVADQLGYADVASLKRAMARWGR